MAVDLRLEEEVGRQPFRHRWIDPIERVLDEKAGGGGLAVFVLHPDDDRMRGTGIEQQFHVVPEPHVLAALPDVDPDERRPLSGVAAADLQDRVLDGKAGQPRPHGRLRVERHVRPALAHVHIGQDFFRLRRAPGTGRGDVDVAQVRALDRQRRRHARIVEDLHEEQAGPSLDQLRRRRSLLEPDAALRTDVDGDEGVGIQDLLNPGDRCRFITHPNRIVQCGVVGVAQRFAEIPERGLQAPDLLRERLQRPRRRRRREPLLRTQRADGCED